MKSLKTHITKFFAIVMSILYVLMPIHKEVKRTLHGISHYLEMPDVILSHNHNENLNYKFKQAAIVFHEHKILDLLDSLTDTNTNTKDSNKPNLVDSKIDKHFHSSNYVEHKLVSDKSLAINTCYKEKMQDGFYKKIKIPPKTTKMQLS